jgi:dihydrofolate reductase
MSEVILDISVSIDGYVAGPNPTLEDPLGERGMELHEWVFPLKSWRSHHGIDGGEEGEDDARVARSLARVGAQVMGRRMFSGGSGPWDADSNAAGWWGDEPPFRVPVFVVTHHARPDVATQCLRAGLLDRIDLHIAPLLLGSGAKLFAGVEPSPLELVEAHASPRATHVSYRPR